MNGEGGLNRIDIVQKDGIWGFYATSGSASDPDVANGLPGTISVQVNSTWVSVPNGTVNNGARAYLEAINRVYSLGGGYVMGYKTSSDVTYENFWNHTFNTLTAATIGGVTAGVSGALESIFGATIGGIVGDYLNGFIPTSSITTDADKLRNDIVLDALQNNSIANYTPGMTMGGTLRFVDGDALSPTALTIDMKDLMTTVSNHMKSSGLIDKEGNINEDLRGDYMNLFNQQTQGSTTMLDLIQKLGGFSTRLNSSTGGAGGGGSSNGNGSDYSPAVHVGPGYTEPLPDGTYYPETPVMPHKFFFFNQTPNLVTDQQVSSDPVSYIYPAEGGFIENNIYTDEAGDRWLLIFCENAGEVEFDGGVGSGARWAASKLGR